MGRTVRGCRVRGPLAPWQAGFEVWLLGRGYLPSAVFQRCWLLAAMSLWLEWRGLDAWELTEERGGAVRGRAARGWVEDVGLGPIGAVAA